MNAKVCKGLRRLAERSTTGAPSLRYEWNRNGSVFIPRRSSTRGVYLALKKKAAAPR